MMEFMEIIKTRRSIRKFEDKDVEQEKIEKLLESVKWAQSWANTQCWEVIVVKDMDVKKKLQETVPNNNPAYLAIVNAPVVFVMVAKLKQAGYYKGKVTTKFGDWFMFDIGIATQNLCLTAKSLGLGGVVVGLFDQDKAKKVLGVPDGYEVVVMVPMGYPAQDPKPPKRKEISEFVHYEKF